MSRAYIRVNSKNQITIPKIIRKMLGINAGDQVLIDVQDNVMMILKPAGYTGYFQNLHSEIWKSISTENYLRNERAAW